MGQYYKAIVGPRDGGWELEKYEMDGAKLMEFSYADNRSLAYLMQEFKNGPRRLVFMGDYGDDAGSKNPKVADSMMMKLHHEAWETEDECIELLPSYVPEMPRFYFNHTKRLWFDLFESIACSAYASEGYGPACERTSKRPALVRHAAENGMREPEVYFSIIHPLPILCSHGNGQGGGDYFGFAADSAGTWAWDMISACSEISEEHLSMLDMRWKKIVPVFFSN